MPETTKLHVRRVASESRITPQIFDLLDRDYAPFHVCRWVAGGRWLQDRVVRLALATLLRREARADKPGTSPSGWAWAHDRLYRTAENHFWETPHAAKLMRAKLLAARGESLPGQGGLLYTVLWDQTWDAIQRELATIDRERFLDEVKAMVAQRRKRSVRRRGVKLGPGELAYVGALDTIKRGVLRGHITVEEASAQQQAQGKRQDERRSR